MERKIKELSDIRVQKLMNQAYSVFKRLYKEKYPDIYYDGLVEFEDEEGFMQLEDDMYGHYIIVGKDYFTIDVTQSIEDFGFSNHQDDYSQLLSY